ncbi:MAG: hypothetical protein ACJA0Q_001217, partial [Saprospiraceae bacterium]
MKKFLGSVCLVTLLISCGGNSIEDRVDIGNDTTNLEESFQDN